MVEIEKKVKIMFSELTKGGNLIQRNLILSVLNMESNDISQPLTLAK